MEGFFWLARGASAAAECVFFPFSFFLRPPPPYNQHAHAPTMATVERRKFTLAKV